MACLLACKKRFGYVVRVKDVAATNDFIGLVIFDFVLGLICIPKRYYLLLLDIILLEGVCHRAILTLEVVWLILVVAISVIDFVDSIDLLSLLVLRPLFLLKSIEKRNYYSCVWQVKTENQNN